MISTSNIARPVGCEPTTPALTAMNAALNSRLQLISVLQGLVFTQRVETTSYYIFQQCPKEIFDIHKSHNDNPYSLVIILCKFSNITLFLSLCGMYIIDC